MSDLSVEGAAVVKVAAELQAAASDVELPASFSSGHAGAVGSSAVLAAVLESSRELRARAAAAAHDLRHVAAAPREATEELGDADRHLARAVRGG